MARLVVFRGEARDSKSLDQLPVRLGRAPQNDIVLEDPAKSVSRVHAEIRLEGGRYVLVDLKSDNGIWVAGSRVARVELKPNVVASIGPFRLQLETDEAPINIDSEKKAGTRPVAPSPRPIRPPAPRPRPGTWTTRTKWVAAAIATALATAAIIAAVIFLQPAPPTEISPELIREIAAAKLQISDGSCAEALAQHIDPALARDPGNTDLLALKRQAEACVPAPPPPEQGPDPIADSLQSARDLIAAGDCSGALDLHINNVLSGEPANLEALELKTQAEACARSAPTEPRNSLAVRIPPADGGLDLLPAERDQDYRLRVKAMRARYDEAVATAAKGASRAAISAFEAIVKETPPGYLDVSTKLAEARGAWRATARPLVTEARDLAGKGLWNEALQKFRDARGIDPSLSLDDEVRSVEAAKLAAGQQQCKLGKQTVNYDRARALQHFRRAVALLPPADPCYADAKRYVE